MILQQLCKGFIKINSGVCIDIASCCPPSFRYRVCYVFRLSLGLQKDQEGLESTSEWLATHSRLWIYMLKVSAWIYILKVVQISDDFAVAYILSVNCKYLVCHGSGSKGKTERNCGV